MKKRLLLVALSLSAFNIKSAKSNDRALNPTLGTESSAQHLRRIQQDDPIHESLAEVRRRIPTFSGGDIAPPLPPRRATVGGAAENGTGKGKKSKPASRPPAALPRKNAAAALLPVYKPTDGDAYLEPTPMKTNGRKNRDGADSPDDYDDGEPIFDDVEKLAEEVFAKAHLYDNEFDLKI